MSYVINNLLVESLAKSTSFQRFAVYTNELYKEGVKAAEPQMKEQAAKVQTFSKAFYDNMSKEMEQVLKSVENGATKPKAPPRP
eukprot:jgi/Ulvmu1/1356/UM011_0084.1